MVDHRPAAQAHPGQRRDRRALLQEAALGRLYRVEVQELTGQERLPVGVHTLNDRTLPPVGREFIAMLGSSVAVGTASQLAGI